MSWSEEPVRVPGGGEGTRTLNPRLAKAVLCQLSYAPGITDPNADLGAADG